MDMIDQYEEMVAREPNSELYRFSLAQAYYEAGRYPEALTQANFILRIGSNFAPLFRLMALCHIQMEQFEEAKQDLEQGLVAAEEKDDFFGQREMLELMDYVQGELG